MCSVFSLSIILICCVFVYLFYNDDGGRVCIDRETGSIAPRRRKSFAFDSLPDHFATQIGVRKYHIFPENCIRQSSIERERQKVAFNHMGVCAKDGFLVYATKPRV
jgi:hypothetical protein